MYDKKLDIFRAAAETGSFSRAGEKLFLTHTAVKKSVDRLESQLEVKLFDRTNQGISLTPAGECLYREMPKLVKTADGIASKVRRAGLQGKKTVRIGTSTLFPYTSFMGLWEKVSGNLSNYQIAVISSEENVNNFAGLESEYDFQVGPHDVIHESPLRQFIPLGSFRVSVLVPRTGSLSEKNEISLSDLEGEKLMVMKPGRSPANDRLYIEIKEQYPDIETIETDAPYTIDTFNRCAAENCCLIIPECWANIHPLLTCVPLKEDFFIPYGIIASSAPDSDTASFLEEIKKYTE